MSDGSSIEWTDASWNPVRGCTKVSPGCKNCYAERFSERWRGVPGHAYEQGFDLRLVPEKLEDPIRWRKPRNIFVCSMSDLFQADVPDSYIDRVFWMMEVAHWHTFQVLTKRADRMAHYLQQRSERRRDFNEILPNVLVGVSVENVRHGVPRMNTLRRIVGWRRFLSIEPLIEDLELKKGQLADFDWVIVGGESGPGARPMKAEWVRPIRDECLEKGVRSSSSSGAASTKNGAGASSTVSSGTRCRPNQESDDERLDQMLHLR